MTHPASIPPDDDGEGLRVRYQLGKTEDDPPPSWSQTVGCLGLAALFVIMVLGVTYLLTH